MSEQPLCVSTLPLPVGSSGKRSQHDSMVAYDCNMPCGGLPENARRPREEAPRRRRLGPLGDRSAKIVAEVSYELSDPTIASQIVKLKGSGADVLMDFTTPKFVAQAIRKVRTRGK